MSDSESELSASTICEFECFHFEGMSDTPLELREVVDRSCEAILNSNNLPSTSSVFSHCVLGSVNDEMPLLDTMMIQMEKMYMEDDDDTTPCLLQTGQVGYTEAPTSSTPTSHERDYQGMGVDVTMNPLVEMMNVDCLHELDDSFDVTYECFLFPCDTLPQNNVDHVVSSIGDKNTIHLFCNQCFYYSPFITTKTIKTCSFKCLVCNDEPLIYNEIAPIALSHFRDFTFSLMDLVPTFTLNGNYPHMSYVPIDFDVVGDMQMKRHFMMDDVFIYHAHNFFIWFFVCIRPHAILSTSLEHELTKRAHTLESWIEPGSNTLPMFCIKQVEQFPLVLVCLQTCL